MKKKLFTLLTLLMAVCSGAWADDYTLGASSFNSAKTIATVNGVEFTFSIAHGGTGQTGYSEYIKFSANKTYTLTLPTGFILTNINVKGYTNKDNKTDGSFKVGDGDSQTLPARNDANLSTNAAITDGYDYPISQTGGTVAFSTSGSGNQICVLITITGTAPAAVAVDPEFSLSSSSISTSQTGQIKVGTKDDLDGIKLSSITYGTSGVVTVDEDGVITPVAAGTTTINFSSGEVTDKYNASTGNSLTISVINATTVFDASALNAEFVLSKTNIQTAGNEFVTTSTEDWSERTPSGYSTTNYYNLSSTSRYITFTASGASTFQIIIQNGNGSNNRKYTVKIGDAEGEDITAPKNTTSVSKVFATGTTGEVTIKIIGTSDGSLYPAAIKFNPAASGTITGCGWSTFCSADYKLDLSGVTNGTAYYASAASGSTVTLTTCNDKITPVGEGLMIKGTAGATFTIPASASDATFSATNHLVGQTTTGNVAASGTDGKYHYVFGFVTETPTTYGFYNLNADTSVPAGKAYLETKTELTGARIAMIFDDEEATGINNVKREEISSNRFYNLNGQEIAQPSKGLYIVNGKKVVIK